MAANVKAGTLVATGFPDPTGNLITDTDPFPAGVPRGPGTSYPNDSTIELFVTKTFLPAGSVFVNVCSYPSAGNGGNADPKDCITTPGGGFLVIQKDAGTDTTTPFPFTVSPVPAGQPSVYTVNGSGATAAIGLTIGNVSVTEAVPTGWMLSSVVCTKSDGTPTGAAAINGRSAVAIESGKVTTCKFTDVKDAPRLTVDKTSTTTSITAAGQVVPYSFLVTNTGNVTVTGIAVTDPKVPTISCPATSLAPSAFMTCTGSHTVTLAEMDAAGGTLVNTVTVKSSAPDATDTNTIPVAKTPRLTVDKTSSTTSITVGRSGRAVQLPRDEHRQRDGHGHRGHRSEGPDDQLPGDVAGADGVHDVYRQPHRDAGGDRCSRAGRS